MQGIRHKVTIQSTVSTTTGGLLGRYFYRVVWKLIIDCVGWWELGPGAAPVLRVPMIGGARGCGPIRGLDWCHVTRSPPTRGGRSDGSHPVPWTRAVAATYWALPPPGSWPWHNNTCYYNTSDNKIMGIVVCWQLLEKLANLQIFNFIFLLNESFCVSKNYSCR